MQEIPSETPEAFVATPENGDSSALPIPEGMVVIPPAVLEEKKKPQKHHDMPVPLQVGVLLSVGWVAMASGYGAASVGLERIASLLPGEMVVFLIAAFLPLVVVWLMVMVVMRRSDLAVVTEDLFFRIGLTPEKLGDRISGMEGALASINVQAHLLDENVAQNMRKVEGVREKLAQEILRLDGSLQDSFQKLSRMVDVAVQGGEGLVADAGVVAGRMENAAKIIGNQAAETLSGMEGRLQSMSAVMETAAKHAELSVSVSASGVEEKFDGLLRNLQVAGEQLDARVNAADALSIRCAEASDRFQAQAGHFSGMLSEAENWASKAEEGFSGRLSGMAQTAEQIAGKLEALLVRLDRKKEDLLAAGERGMERAEGLRTAISGSVSEISRLSGRFAQDAKQLTSEALHQGKDLVRAVDEGMARIEGLSEKLGDKAADVAEKARGLDEVLGAAVGRLEVGRASLAAVSSEVGTNLSSAVSLVEDGERRILDAVSHMKTEMTASGEAFSVRHEQVIQAADGMGLVLGGLAERLHLLSSELVRMSQEAETRAGGAADVFAGRLAELQQGVVVAGHLISSMADSLRQASAEVAQHAEDGALRIRGAGDELRDQENRLREGAENATGVLENARTALSRQAQDVLEAASRATAHLEEVGSLFRIRMEDVGQEAPKIVENIRHAAEMAREVSSGLADAVTHSAAEMMSAAEHVREEMASLGVEAGAAVDTLNIAESGIETAMGRIRGELAQALVEISEVEKKIGGDASSFAEAARMAVSGAQAATHEMELQLQTIRLGTKGVSEMMEAARQGLAEEAERFVGSAGEKLVAARAVAAEFGEQAKNLTSASREALQQAEILRNTEFRSKRETFLNSAKFVLENLRSMSVDMVRLLEGEVPEKQWKAYLHGETGVFVKQLVSMKYEAGATQKFRDRYEENAAFRTVVQNYVRQFEENLAQAVALDNGDLLTSVFMTSDIGKIYLFLAQLIKG